MAFADWKGLRTKMIWTAGSGFILLVGSMGLSIWGMYWEIYTPETGIKAAFTTHILASTTAINNAEEERGIQSEQLEQILRHLEKDYYLSGQGSVGTFGGDDVYVRINRRSDANVYKDGDRVRVTCGMEGKPEAVFRVNGTFSNTNPDILISFSKEAADSLGVVRRIDVELEPILPEK